MEEQELETLAWSLAQAWATAEATPAPTSVLPGITMNDAYAIQERVINRRVAAGAHRVGWKLGLTSSPDATPIVGTLLNDMVVESDSMLKLPSMVAPLIEAEIAIVVGEPITLDTDAEAIAGGDHQIAPALEVIDYRTSGSSGVIDWVADNSTVAYAVLGPRRSLAEVGPPNAIEVSLRCDDVEIARGRGHQVMGDPLRAVVWLVQHLNKRGRRLEHGTVILTGSLTGHHEVTPGSDFAAMFAGLGDVAVHFAGD